MTELRRESTRRSRSLHPSDAHDSQSSAGAPREGKRPDDGAEAERTQRNAAHQSQVESQAAPSDRTTPPAVGTPGPTAPAATPPQGDAAPAPPPGTPTDASGAPNSARTPDGRLTVDLDAIEKRANAATGGRWHIVLGSGRNLCTGIAAEFEDGGTIFVADCLPDYAAVDGGPEDHRPTMEYIAAMSPDVALALVAECRRLASENARLERALQEQHESTDDIWNERTALRAAVFELAYALDYGTHWTPEARAKFEWAIGPLGSHGEPAREVTP